MHSLLSTNQIKEERTRKAWRYIWTMCMILAMIGVSELSGENEILFPEMAALTIGMWIVDKRVWRVTPFRLVFLMTAGAVAGICIVRYSPLPLIGNIAVSFLFTALCLTAARSTLIPQISACMLPVLLHTESWVYPLSVLVMSLIVVCGQHLMVKCRIRQKTYDEPDETNWKESGLKWVLLLCSILIIALIPVYTANIYCILPPLIVTFVEFSNSRANFRNRPLQIWFFLVVAATLGSGFLLAGHVCLGWPKAIVALFIFSCLFMMFEKAGKFFAPAGAVALIPMIIPPADLLWFPLQAAAGAGIFIAVSMILFHKCHTWTHAQLIYCLTPDKIRKMRKRRGPAGTRPE